MRVIVAKDALSAMVKLAAEIEESTYDVIDYSMFSNLLTHPRDALRRAMLSFPSRLTDCRMQVGGVLSKRRLVTR